MARHPRERNFRRGIACAAVIFECLTGGAAAADSGLAPGLYGTTESGEIVSIDPVSGAWTSVLQLNATVYDIAFDAGGDLWVLERATGQDPEFRLHLYDPVGGGLDLRTGACAFQNGLDVREEDGVLLASGDRNFYLQERDAAICPTRIGIGDQSAGDVAHGMEGRTFVTARGTILGDYLIEVDVQGGSSWRVGGLENPCGGLFAPTWEGLAFLQDGRMVASTRGWGCDRLAVLDPDSGAILREVDLGIELSGLAYRASECPPPLLGEPPRASDPESCEAGLLVEWGPADWPPGRSGVYNLYRAEPDCSVPPAPLVLGLTGTRYLDLSTVAPGTYSYLVEAEDDSGCGTGPYQSGMTARSACTVPLADSVDREAPPDRAGWTLVVRKPDPLTASLDWSDAGLQAGERFVVYRAGDGPGPFEALQPDPAVIPFADSDPVPVAGSWFYLVATLDACDNGAPP